MKLVTGAGMQVIDEAAIQQFGIPGIVLMENAGRAAAEEILRMSEQPMKTLILCGKGNNGGDGYVIGRTLKQAGWPVTFAAIGGKDVVRGDCSVHFSIIQKLSMTVHEILPESILEPIRMEELRLLVGSAELIVDAVLGTGLSGEVAPLQRAVLEMVNNEKKPFSKVVAVDLPSGINSDTGALMGTAIKADVTISFTMAKRGVVLYPGAAYCGQLIIKDIGIPKEAYPAGAPFCQWIDDASVRLMLPRRQPDSHKGTYGRVCLLAGSEEMGGAALLSARAVLRSGAGLLRAFVPESLKSSMLQALPEAIVHSWQERTLDKILESCVTSQVTAVGPGCGRTPLLTLTLGRLLSSVRTPLVIDADGLNVLSEPQLMERLALRQEPVIITPHPGEMSRLAKLSVEAVLADPVAVATQFARQWDVIVVLKGARTVVASPKGDVWISSAGNSGMATAGAGDVLTGIIASFIAQGLEPIHAAVAGVHLHGLSGDHMSALKGEPGLIAGDLIDGMTDVFKRLK